MIELYQDAIQAAKAHARAEYPREACGLIVGTRYLACENLAEPVEAHREGDDECPCKLCAFVIDPKVYQQQLVTGQLKAVVHSHPNGPFFPSRSDMLAQVNSGVTWAIIALDEERIADPVVWGGDVPIPPMVGRRFLHGVTDCYSLIRDAYALGKDALAEQGIEEWPFPPIKLPEFPRDDDWWNRGFNLYDEGSAEVGFVEISSHEAKPGDVFLGQIRSDKNNHAGLLIGGGLILHHLPNRLSRREPAGIWGRHATKWIRYRGPIDA